MGQIAGDPRPGMTIYYLPISSRARVFTIIYIPTGRERERREKDYILPWVGHHRGPPTPDGLRVTQRDSIPENSGAVNVLVSDVGTFVA